jgi:hypothetical protein
MAYDALGEATPGRATREYLAILELAAREDESQVDEALRTLLDEERPITAQAVVDRMGHREPARPVTEVRIDATELSIFDMLFHHKEVWDDFGDGGESPADRVPAGAAFAHVP